MPVLFDLRRVPLKLCFDDLCFQWTIVGATFYTYADSV